MVVLSLNDYPPGVGFNPTDQQIINFYLPSKINGNEEAVKHIPEVDLRKFEPRDLPAMSLVEPNDGKWFFFCRKYKNRNRPDRKTREGYWKVTCKDRLIKSGQEGTVIGMKKTLVFCIGRAGKGEKRTNWVIHEYHATSKELDGTKPGQKGSFVLLKLKKKQLDGEIIEGSNGTTIHTSMVQPDTDPGLLEYFADSIPEPLDDFLAKIPSPSHSQLQPDDVGPDPSGVHFLYGPNDQDINDYLVEDFGRYQNSPVERGVDAELTSFQLCSAKLFRPRYKPHGHLSHLSNFRLMGYEEENHEAKVVAKISDSYKVVFVFFFFFVFIVIFFVRFFVFPLAEEAEEKHSVTADPAAIIDETQDKCLSKSNDVTKVAQEPASSMKSGSDLPRGGDNEVASVSLKASPALLSNFSSMHVFGVLLAVGLPIVVVGLWRWLEF